MKQFLLLASAFFVGCTGPSTSTDTQTKPNFIVILADDQGYGDLGVYGSPDIKTPNIDQMAAEGVLFTDFYVQPFCGPSRAALMTGSYPPRNSLAFNHGPGSKTGIHPNEVTIAELLKEQGYATKIVGKWHLGSEPQFLPMNHGFDSFYGLPYSNDMWPFHPRMPITENEHPRMVAARERAAKTGFAGQGSYRDEPWPDLPLLSGDEVIELNSDQSQLTKNYTEKALEFITENKDQPFFLYLPHTMPHVPIFASEQFLGKSKRGLYGDVIEEIDWGVGEILAKLKELGLDEKTLVVFTSDNGPWLQYGIDGGSAGPLRAGKGTTFEGGQRVPSIMRWPGRIPAGTRTSEVAAIIDLLPTLAGLAGTSPPTDRVIDGKDIWPLMSGQPGAKSLHEAFYYYAGNPPDQAPRLRAIRSGRWKLHLESEDDSFRGHALYDLVADIGESEDAMADNPDVVERLLSMAKIFNDELKESVRPLGR